MGTVGCIVLCIVFTMWRYVGVGTMLLIRFYQRILCAAGRYGAALIFPRGD